MTPLEAQERAREFCGQVCKGNPCVFSQINPDDKCDCKCHRIASALLAVERETLDRAQAETETFIHMKWPGDQKHEDAACDDLLARLEALSGREEGK